MLELLFFIFLFRDLEFLVCVLFLLFYFSNPVHISFLLLDSVSALFFLLAALLVFWISFLDHSTKSWVLKSLFLVSSFFYFFSNSFLLFFVSFEFFSLPMVFYLLFSGYSYDRVSASIYMALYMIFFSFPLFLVLFSLSSECYSYSWTSLKEANFNSLSSAFLILPFLAKLPAYTLHHWLPKAHSEASTLGSVLLAALLLKLSSFGLLRLLNFMNLNSGTLILVLLCGSLGASTASYNTSDIKSAIAYSSISHMNFGTASFISGFESSSYGYMILSLTHGLISSVLFSFAGYFSHSKKSRLIFIARVSFVSSLFLAFLFLGVAFSNFSLPPFTSFMGEMPMISSVILWSSEYSLFFSVLIVSVSYISLFLVLSTLLGKKPHNSLYYTPFYFLPLFVFLLLLLSFNLLELLF